MKPDSGAAMKGRVDDAVESTCTADPVSTADGCVAANEELCDSEAGSSEKGNHDKEVA